MEGSWPRQNVAGYDVGPKKMSEHFCYIALHEDHVNLGFNQGAELPDPKGLLEGPGKMPRHTKIAEPEDLEGTTDVWLARWETVGAHNSTILLRPCSYASLYRIANPNTL